MMWPAMFELGAWCAAAFAVSIAPHTERRGMLLAASCLAALLAGTVARLLHSPAWHLHKVDPVALVAATAAAAIVALTLLTRERRSREDALPQDDAALQSCPSTPRR